MRTIIYHQNLGCYDFCHTNQKSESYRFTFDENDKEHKTIEFDYDEEDAPCLDVDKYSVTELISELEGYESKRYLYSSSYGRNKEMNHEKRIELCFKFAEENKVEDNKARAEYLYAKANKMMEQAQKLKSEADGLIMDALQEV